MRLSNGVRLLAVAATLLFAGDLAAQSTATLAGRVTDESGAALSGVQIVVTNQVSGAQTGALTQSDGRYTIAGLRAGGPYRVEARFIGYGLQAVDDIYLEPDQTRVVDFRLSQEAIGLDALEVFATRAVERKTPVAFTDVSKVEIQNQLGSRDLPLVLNVTPSVYATGQGGGAGDARINVRGFSQRNTAVMINGVPVNDMENGWVYWSNWDGLGDASTSIQLQRGLSAVNLATPSIGGTLNVITDPASVRKGFSYKQEFGSGKFLKETFVANTGEMGAFSLTASVVRKTADGIYEGIGGDATWTDAWAYYLASSYQLNARNRIEFYAVGAPQRHGQNLYKLNLGTLDRDFALSLDDYDPKAIAQKFKKEGGRTWSPNVNSVDPSYTGKQFTSTGPGAGTFARHNPNYINERENYFHKPQVNLNWYSYFGGGLTLSTVAYYSGGNGGGTGTYGSSRNASFNYDYGQRVPDWDGTIAKNRARGDGSAGFILRNSVNNQWTIGAISKLRKDFSGGLTLETGIDWRTAEVDHYREVRDLLGGTYYFETRGSQFWTDAEKQRSLGDKINYFNTNKINWLGTYLQAEKSDRDGSFYGMVGWAQNKYDYTDHFKKGADGGELQISSGNISGYQIKGGAVRNVTDEWSLFGNAGYVSKVPIFDGVIDDRNGVKNPNPKNEKFISYEVGVQYRSMDRGVSFDLNLYHTTWKDRTRNVFVRNLEGDGRDGLVNLLGVNARHMGIEAQAAWQPNDLWRFDAAASVGNWKYLDDVTGTYKPDDFQAETQTFNFYIADLKVGDAPQTQFAYAVSLFPAEGFYLRFQGKTFRDHYADFNPFDRSTTDDRGVQSWSPPGYTVFDLHASYRIADVLPAGGDLRVFANVYNLLDAVYVQDARDNSRFNAWDKDHDADDAEVFLGIPRTFNLGFQVNF
ncbi:MAG: TonB-dependent receptor [Gemmatimonadota bacterium]